MSIKKLFSCLLLIVPLTNGLYLKENEINNPEDIPLTIQARDNKAFRSLSLYKRKIKNLGIYSILTGKNLHQEANTKPYNSIYYPDTNGNSIDPVHKGTGRIYYSDNQNTSLKSEVERVNEKQKVRVNSKRSFRHKFRSKKSIREYFKVPEEYANSQIVLSESFQNFLNKINSRLHHQNRSKESTSSPLITYSSMKANNLKPISETRIIQNVNQKEQTKFDSYDNSNAKSLVIEKNFTSNNGRGYSKTVLIDEFNNQTTKSAKISYSNNLSGNFTESVSEVYNLLTIPSSYMGSKKNISSYDYAVNYTTEFGTEYSRQNNNKNYSEIPENSEDIVLISTTLYHEMFTELPSSLQNNSYHQDFSNTYESSEDMPTRIQIFNPYIKPYVTYTDETTENHHHFTDTISYTMAEEDSRSQNEKLYSSVTESGKDIKILEENFTNLPNIYFNVDDKYFQPIKDHSGHFINESIILNSFNKTPEVVTNISQTTDDPLTNSYDIEFVSNFPYVDHSERVIEQTENYEDFEISNHLFSSIAPNENLPYNNSNIYFGSDYENSTPLDHYVTQAPEYFYTHAEIFSGFPQTNEVEYVTVTNFYSNIEDDSDQYSETLKYSKLYNQPIVKDSADHTIFSDSSDQLATKSLNIVNNEITEKYYPHSEASQEISKVISNKKEYNFVRTTPFILDRESYDLLTTESERYSLYNEISGEYFKPALSTGEQLFRSTTFRNDIDENVSLYDQIYSLEKESEEYYAFTEISYHVTEFEKYFENSENYDEYRTTSKINENLFNNKNIEKITESYDMSISTLIQSENIDTHPKSFEISSTTSQMHNFRSIPFYFHTDNILNLDDKDSITLVTDSGNYYSDKNLLKKNCTSESENYYPDKNISEAGSSTKRNDFVHVTTDSENYYAYGEIAEDGFTSTFSNKYDQYKLSTYPPNSYENTQMYNHVKNLNEYSDFHVINEEGEYANFNLYTESEKYFEKTENYEKSETSEEILIDTNIHQNNKTYSSSNSRLNKSEHIYTLPKSFQTSSTTSQMHNFRANPFYFHTDKISNVENNESRSFITESVSHYRDKNVFVQNSTSASENYYPDKNLSEDNSTNKINSFNIDSVHATTDSENFYAYGEISEDDITPSFYNEYEQYKLSTYPSHPYENSHMYDHVTTNGFTESLLISEDDELNIVKDPKSYSTSTSSLIMSENIYTHSKYFETSSTNSQIHNFGRNPFYLHTNNISNVNDNENYYPDKNLFINNSTSKSENYHLDKNISEENSTNKRNSLHIDSVDVTTDSENYYAYGEISEDDFTSSFVNGDDELKTTTYHSHAYKNIKMYDHVRNLNEYPASFLTSEEDTESNIIYDRFDSESEIFFENTENYDQTLLIPQTYDGLYVGINIDVNPKYNNTSNSRLVKSENVYQYLKSIRTTPFYSHADTISYINTDPITFITESVNSNLDKNLSEENSTNISEKETTNHIGFSNIFQGTETEMNATFIENLEKYSTNKEIYSSNLIESKNLYYVPDKTTENHNFDTTDNLNIYNISENGYLFRNVSEEFSTPTFGIKINNFERESLYSNNKLDKSATPEESHNFEHTEISDKEHSTYSQYVEVYVFESTTYHYDNFENINSDDHIYESIQYIGSENIDLITEYLDNHSANKQHTISLNNDKNIYLYANLDDIKPESEYFLPNIKISTKTEISESFQTVTDSNNIELNTLNYENVSFYNSSFKEQTNYDSVLYYTKSKIGNFKEKNIFYNNIVTSTTDSENQPFMKILNEFSTTAHTDKESEIFQPVTKILRNTFSDTQVTYPSIDGQTESEYFFHSTDISVELETTKPEISAKTYYPYLKNSENSHRTDLSQLKTNSSTVKADNINNFILAFKNISSKDLMNSLLSRILNFQPITRFETEFHTNRKYGRLNNDDEDNPLTIRNDSPENNVVIEKPFIRNHSTNLDSSLELNNFNISVGVDDDDSTGSLNQVNESWSIKKENVIDPFRYELPRRSDILIEEDFEPDDSNIDYSDYFARRKEETPPQPVQQSLLEALNLIPLIIEQYRLGHVTAYEEDTLAQIFGNIWPLIVEEANREPEMEANPLLKTLLWAHNIEYPPMDAVNNEKEVKQSTIDSKKRTQKRALRSSLFEKDDKFAYKVLEKASFLNHRR